MEPINTLSVPQAVVQQVLYMIKDGTWQVGEKLPPQRQLAQELQVGLSSLREALQTLRSMGVLEIRRGQGMFVSRSQGQIVERVLNLALTLNRDEMEDFLDARRAVEGGLAFLAAKHASDEQIERLQALLDTMGELLKYDSDASLDKLDLAFHKLVAEMSNSHLLSYLGDILFESLEEFLPMIPHTTQGLQKHIAVFQAIVHRDADCSQIAMHDLVDATSKYLFLLKQHEIPAINES